MGAAGAAPSAGRQPAVAIEGLSLSFGGRKVLDGIDASFPAGGLSVLVGPNGAGKTSLLLCALGELPHGGRVRLRPDLRGRVGYVPQTLRLELASPVTCAEFLALSVSRRPLWLGLGGETARGAGRVLDRVGLSGATRRRLDELSGGELRRALLASALMRSPGLLLLDEPAAGVDLRGERLFWELLRELRLSEGITIVMVSHNLPLAAHYASHVLCLFGGRCLEGPPRQVLTAGNLMAAFGMPIHLYPDQCAEPQGLCPDCGAFAPRSCPHGRHAAGPSPLAPLGAAAKRGEGAA